MVEQEERTRRHVLSTTRSDLDRRARGERRKSERRLIAEARRAEGARRAAQAKAEREAWRSADYLPKSGEKGPAALWNPREFAAPTHRASTGILGTAYPFLADPGLGTKGILIGRNRLGSMPFVFDPFTLYKSGLISDPNIVISGKVGEGKSTLMKCLISRGSVFGYRSYIPADVKGEWTGPVRRIGGTAFEIGPGMLSRINCLETPIRRPPSISEHEWAVISRNRRQLLLEAICDRLESARPLESRERSALRYALEQVDARVQGTPTLGHVVHELFHPSKDARDRVPEGFRDMRDVRAESNRAGHILATLTVGALGGVLDRDSAGVTFDPSVPGLSIDVSRLEGNALLDVVMTCTSTWMEAALRDGTDSRRFMVYDEGWRVFGRPSLLHRMQENWKVSRNWGISNILTMHGFGDLDTAGDGQVAARAMAANLVTDSATVISFRQSGRATAAAEEMLDLTDTAGALLPRLGKGQSVWRVGQQTALVQVTRTPREAAVFDTDDRMVASDAAA